MKTPTALFILLCTIVGGGVLWAQQGTTGAEPADRETSIEELEARVARLEQRIAALESEKQPDFKLFQPDAPASVTPEPDWIEHEFDGQTFYLIPLSEGEDELELK